MGASAFLKSVYFRAFAVNVKTIALKKYLYQFGHAIWCGRSVDKIIIYLLPDFFLFLLSRKARNATTKLPKDISNANIPMKIEMIS